MGDRERRGEPAEQVHAPAGPPPAASSLADARQRGERMLAAADEAIRRTLSGDSEGFMRASRQEGGQ